MANNKKLTLFYAVPEENLCRITDGIKQFVPHFSVLKDLVSLIGVLDRADAEVQNQRKWWIARVDCSPEQVVELEGSYRPINPIAAPEGYIPLEDALIRYSGIIQNA